MFHGVSVTNELPLRFKYGGWGWETLEEELTSCTFVFCHWHCSRFASALLIVIKRRMRLN